MLTLFKHVFLTVPDIVLRNRSVRVGDDVLLQCELSSNLATPLWTLNGGDLQGYGLNSGSRTGTDGLLLIEAQQEQSGLYTCHAVENGIKVAIISYKVTVRPDLPVPPPSDRDSLIPTFPPPSLPPSSEAPQESHPVLSAERSYSRNVEVIYLSLVIVLGSLCFVLAVVLVYVGFCLQAGTRGKYSLRAATAAHPCSRKCGRGRKQQRNSALMELKTISNGCNGNGMCNGGPKLRNGSLQRDGGFLQIVPGEGHTLPSKGSPPPAPPLPPTSQLPSPPSDFAGGFSATLPSVLRRINGNSYVLLRQYDSENSSPQCNPFAEELNKILEKRKHTQLLPRPDESSV